MAAPLISLTNNCCEKLKMSDKWDCKTTGNKVFGAAVALDLIVTLSAIAVGVLALLGYLPLPAAAAYGCFGGAGAIVALYGVKLAKGFICPKSEIPCFKPKSSGSTI